MRVLVTIVGQGSVVHIIRTGLLQGMRAFCEPVVAILWNQPDLIEELRSKGFEVHIIPEYETSNYYQVIRNKINRWYLKNVLKSPSTAIQEKYLRQFISFKKRNKKRLINITENLKNTFSPARNEKYILVEDELIRKEECWETFSEWLSTLSVDGLFTVTPFLQEVEIIARILKQKQAPVVASIHSFDNVTKRGWSALSFDHYIVWNKYNKAELQRINKKLSDNNITIAGAPQFDFHFRKKKNCVRSEWLKKMGLPVNKKIILYSGGPANLFPQEPQYLKDLIDAFTDEKIKEEAIIFFRSHPLDKKERWEIYTGKSYFIKYDNAPNGKQKLDYANVTLEDIDQLMFTLEFTDVHINLCSTMTVDGCAFDKPQIGPAYEPSKGKQRLLEKMYFQEHFVPIMKTGAVKLARSKEELVALTNKALQEPDAFGKERQKCLEEIITYTDGESTGRVLSTLKKFFSE